MQNEEVQRIISIGFTILMFFCCSGLTYLKHERWALIMAALTLYELAHVPIPYLWLGAAVALVIATGSIRFLCAPRHYVANAWVLALFGVCAVALEVTLGRYG